jgi:hypothetical protein
MRLEGSMPCSEEPFIGPHLQPDEYSPHPIPLRFIKYRMRQKNLKVLEI